MRMQLIMITGASLLLNGCGFIGGFMGRGGEVVADAPHAATNVVQEGTGVVTEGVSGPRPPRTYYYKKQ